MPSETPLEDRLVVYSTEDQHAGIATLVGDYVLHGANHGRKWGASARRAIESSSWWQGPTERRSASSAWRRSTGIS